MTPWYVELYRVNGIDPIWHGHMRFATLEALLVAAKCHSAQMIFRVMGSKDAPENELAHLKLLGAART